MKKKIKAGKEEAAKILSGLPPENRAAVMELLAQKDPLLLEELKKNMVVFEDLVYLTTKMLQNLLREIKLDDLGLGLRMGSEELKEHILSNVSSRMKKDILETLQGPPREVTLVQEATERIMEVVRDKVEKGELVLVKGKGEGKDFV